MNSRNSFQVNSSPVFLLKIITVNHEQIIYLRKSVDRLYKISYNEDGRKVWKAQTESLFIKQNIECFVDVTVVLIKITSTPVRLIRVSGLGRNTRYTPRRRVRIY
ncbi:Protein of unknown function [Gryllus bimaculatus]|nr:Protein of unknown function [Gryllus bimaculatus]